MCQRGKAIGSQLGGSKVIYFHNAPVSWLRAHTFVPYFSSARDGQRSSTQLRPLTFMTDDQAAAAAGVISSSLFYLWWITTSDCYHLNRREIDNFRVDLSDGTLVSQLANIATELMSDLLAKTMRRVYVYRTSGRVEYDEFYPKLSKPIIDKIDRVLAEHYGFTEEELDFIINYDIKYRMGRESEES